jgi:hypothetical protein
MKTETQVRITNENVRITENNVQHIGECIALSAIKKMMRFTGRPKSLNKLYVGLVDDIYGYRGYNTTFSDGYDLASEVICFLCHYMGHNLDDLACQNRKGELMTVRFACYRHALRYIEKEYLSPYKTVSIEECSPADASIDFETQYEIEDYTKIDTIIHQMRLTVAETETLNHYMAGLGFVEIAQMQNVNNTTVWRRRKSIQKKYLRYVVMQS